MARNPAHSLFSSFPFPRSGRCPVPEDLSEVLSVGDEVSAARAGCQPGGPEEVWSRAEALYRSGVTPALQLCVRYRGHVVLDRCLGHARGNAPTDPADGPKPLATTHTPMNVFSSAKLVTAMLIHKLDEQGQLHLEDRVSDYIPEFGRHGKRWITFRHLLSHRAGIPNLPPEALDLDLLADPDLMCEMICGLKRAGRPGRFVAYHAISTGFVFAEVVRRITGQTIREVLQKEFREPLGLEWLHYGVAPEDVERVAQNAATGPPIPYPMARMLERALGRPWTDIIDMSNDPRFLTGIVPAGCLLTTARDLSAFLQCMLNDGELDGARVFEPRTIHHALNEASYRKIDMTLFMPLRYGLGPMLGDDPIGIFGPNSRHAFGHVGLSNVFPWADADRDIAVTLITTGKAIVSPHVIPLWQLLSTIGRVFPRLRKKRPQFN